MKYSGFSCRTCCSFVHFCKTSCTIPASSFSSMNISSHFSASNKMPEYFFSYLARSISIAIYFPSPCVQKATTRIYSDHEFKAPNMPKAPDSNVSQCCEEGSRRMLLESIVDNTIRSDMTQRSGTVNPKKKG